MILGHFATTTTAAIGIIFNNTAAGGLYADAIVRFADGSEALAVAGATRGQIVRFASYSFALSERRRRQRVVERAERALGEAACALGVGDPSTRNQVSELDTQIRQARATKTPLAALRAKRDAAVLRLAAEATTDSTVLAGLDQTLRRVHAARHALSQHETKIMEQRAVLLPCDVVEWRRTAIGFSCSVFLVIVSVALMNVHGDGRARLIAQTRQPAAALKASAADPTTQATAAADETELPRLRQEKTGHQFRIRVSKILDLAKENPIPTPTDPPTSGPNRFKGVEDGVMRAIAVHDGQRLFLVGMAVAEVEDPATGKRMFENWKVLFASGQQLQAAREAIERKDIDDYRGRAAFLCANAALFSSVEEPMVSEMMQSPLLSGVQKSSIFASYRRINLEIAKSYEAEFWTVMSLDPSLLAVAK